MPATDAAARARIGRMAGLATAARHDPREYTAKARAVFLDRFLDAVDPDRVLPELERLRRAEAARKDYFVRLAHASAKARAARARRRKLGAFTAEAEAAS